MYLFVECFYSPKSVPPKFLWNSFILLIFQNLLNISEHSFKNCIRGEWHLIMIERKTQNTLLIYIFNFFNTHLIGYIPYPIPDTKEMAKTEYCSSHCNARDWHVCPSGRKVKSDGYTRRGESFNARTIGGDFRWTVKQTNHPESARWPIISRRWSLQN